MSFQDKKFALIKPEFCGLYDFTKEANYAHRACTIVRATKSKIRLVKSREIDAAHAIVWGKSDMKMGTTVTLAANVKAFFDIWHTEDHYEYTYQSNLLDLVGEELVVLSVDDKGWVECQHLESGRDIHVPFAALIVDFDSQIKDLSLPLLQKRLPRFFQAANEYNSEVVRIDGDRFITFESHNGKAGFTIRKCIAANSVENLSNYMQYATAEEAIAALSTVKG